MSPHPFNPDRRVAQLPHCRCGLAFGAALHFRRDTPRVDSVDKR